MAGGRGGALADGGHRRLVREGKARGRRERENDERIAKRGDKKRPFEILLKESPVNGIELKMLGSIEGRLSNDP